MGSCRTGARPCSSPDRSIRRWRSNPEASAQTETCAKVGGPDAGRLPILAAALPSARHRAYRVPDLFTRTDLDDEWRSVTGAGRR
jgi:hypothetical protein